MASLSKKKYNPEKFLFDTLNDLDIGFVKISNDGIILNHNLTFNKIFGYDPEENLIGTKTIDYWLNSKEKNKFIEILYKNGIVKNYVTRAKKVDREKFFLQMNFKLNKNSNGDIISSEGTFVDITERIRTEQELKESEEKYKTILDGIVNGVWVTDKDDIIYYTNKGMEKIAGIPSEQIVNAKVLIDFPESTLKYFRPYYLKAKNTLNSVFYDAVPVETPASRQSFQSGWLIPIEKEGKYDGIICTVEDVTERKNALSELKASEEKFSKLFDHANDAIFLLKIVDAKVPGHFVEVNNKACQMYGYTKEEFLKMAPQDIIASECLHEVPSLLHEILKTGHGTFNLTHVNKNGLKIPVEISSHVFELRKEAVTLSIVRDITERKKNEEKLKESEKKLSKLNLELEQIIEERTKELKESEEKYKNLSNELEIILDLIPGLFFCKDRNDIVTRVNQNFAEFLKMKKEDIIGKTSFDLFPEEQARKFREDDLEVINSGIPKLNIEESADNPSGKTWVITSKVPQFNEEGKTIGVIGLAIDITERKEKEKEIIALVQFPSEDPYPILRVSRNRVMYINNAGQKLLNVVNSDQIPEIFQENVKNTFESNQISESEVKFDNRVYSFTIIPIEDADYVNIYGMDITERKHIEENLKEVNKLKSEFLRRASHELKTPLISIKGFSDLILTLYREELNPDILSKLGEINDGCERLQNIINDLIHTSTLESPNLKPKVQKENLSFLIKFCVHELQSLAERRKQSIKLDIHPQLYANIEKEEIHDVLSNLLSNAIKYTPPKGCIDIKTETLEDSIVVSIKDNGIGFTKKEKNRIFQQFGKIERYGQGFDLGIDGNGLGLYISKKIVESHGGKIWMESEGKHKGSTFYFSLPK